MPTMLTAIPTLAESFLHRLWFKGAAGSKAGQSVDDLYMFILWTCLISFTIVIGLAYFFAWKYRRRPGVPTQRSASHNTPLELMWSVVPLLVMVVIFFWGFRGYMDMVVAPGNAEVIRVVGRQWDWGATYDNGREPGPDDFEWVSGKLAPVIVVPAGRPINFLLSSTDVIHSFYIPDMRVKFDVFPNRYTSLTITPLEAGKDHNIFCAEYCGRDHSEMNAVLRVVPYDEFIAHKNKEIVIDDPVEFGKYLYRAKGCIACHTLDGTASTGPSWKGLWGSTNHMLQSGPIDLNTVEAFNNYVRTSVYDPKAQLVEGYGPQMNSYAGLIDQKQLEGLIAFMMSPEVSGQAAPAAPAGQTPAGETPAGQTPAGEAPAQPETPQPPPTPAAAPASGGH